MMNDGFDDMDRISYLPIVVIYHVLSCLPTKEVKTILLSKRWQSMLASYPNLDFDQTYFGKELASRKAPIARYPDIEERRDKFIRLVDHTLLRFREQSQRVRKLKIYFTILKPAMVSFVNRWIGLATESMVEELDLQLLSPRNTWYTLPEAIFAAQSIKVLKLQDLKLELPSHGSIRFHSLQKLALISVHVDVQVITSIISKCPLIEEIELQRCLGLHKVQISGLHNLKLVDILQTDGEIETHIEAPSLQSFSLGHENSRILPRKFNLIACRNLISLCLRRVLISDQPFNDLISGFPLLEVLYVIDCNLLERVKIQNRCLKELLLYSSTVAEVEIDSPNLISLVYSGEMVPLVASTCGSGQWEAFITLYRNDRMDSHWFHKMRDLLAKSKHFKALTLSISCSEILFDMEELRGTELSSAPAVEHVILVSLSSLVDYSAVVDGLMWSCHPKTLSLQIMDTEWESGINFIKVLHEKTLSRFDRSCCHFRSFQCWQHGLKDIECYDGGERVLHWNSLSGEVLNLLQCQTVRFLFKW